MDNKELQKKIHSLKPWYHPIDFGGGVKVLGETSAYAEGRSKHQIELSNNQRGLKKWDYYIAPNLPIPLNGISVLDIGCNSGLFSLHCLKLGATYARGIELGKGYVRQAHFLKDYFSAQDGVNYNFDVIRLDMKNTEKYLDRDFDLCLMLNIFRMIKKYDESVAFLKKIYEKCSYIIIQGTKGNKKDDNTVLQKKMSDAGYKSTVKVMRGTRGVVGIGKK